MILLTKLSNPKGATGSASEVDRKRPKYAVVVPLALLQTIFARGLGGSWELNRLKKSLY